MLKCQKKLTKKKKEQNGYKVEKKALKGKKN